MEAREVDPIRVLLVADLPIVGLGLTTLIGSYAPQMSLVGAVATYAEALQLLNTTEADVIVVDLDGLNVAEGLAELLAGNNARVLALTASRDTYLCDRAILAGASGVVNKAEPVATVGRAIEKIYAGELWIDRLATSRLFMTFARRKAVQDENPELLKIATLTRKELKTVVEIARDATSSNEQIAERLHISEHTLRNHLTAIYAKLGVTNRLGLFVYATKNGLGNT